MTDLERFASRLVERLEARDPTGLHRPINIAELRATILPYRLNRSALGLSSQEDYELLILRLVAEEGGFARTNPPESAARCREEVGSPNPDLEIVEDLNDTTIQLGTRRSALGTRQPPAEPPPSAPEPEPPPPRPSAEPPAPSAEPECRVPSAECRSCHRALPTHREVTFCPYCGTRVGQVRCGRCAAAIEAGWSHCVSCGAAAGAE